MDIWSLMFILCSTLSSLPGYTFSKSTNSIDNLIDQLYKRSKDEVLLSQQKVEVETTKDIKESHQSIQQINKRKVFGKIIQYMDLGSSNTNTKMIDDESKERDQKPGRNLRAMFTCGIWGCGRSTALRGKKQVKENVEEKKSLKNDVMNEINELIQKLF
eukprot:TCONS_00021896-protein